MADNELSCPFSSDRELQQERISLPDQEVHVWQVELNCSAPWLSALSALLSAEEQERAARFRQDVHRQRYIAGRGMLRRLLGRYTGLAPEALRFVGGPNGKPELAAECNPTVVQFNRTDSESLALYAFCRERRVGIDVEKMCATRDMASLARSFFTANETAALLSLPAAQRVPAFYACWTRKEAYLKARGDGLTFGLNRFEVSLLPNAPTVLLNTPFDPAETLRWSLHDLKVPSGYAAALAVETQAAAPMTLTQFVAAIGSC